METLNLFSTPVYKNKLGHENFDKVQKEIFSSLKEVEFISTNKLHPKSFDYFNTKVSDNIENSNSSSFVFNELNELI